MGTGASGAREGRHRSGSAFSLVVQQATTGLETLLAVGAKTGPAGGDGDEATGVGYRKGTTWIHAQDMSTGVFFFSPTRCEDGATDRLWLGVATWLDARRRLCICRMSRHGTRRSGVREAGPSTEMGLMPGRVSEQCGRSRRYARMVGIVACVRGGPAPNPVPPFSY